MSFKPLHLYIDGSAKENFIGAGLIVVKPQQSTQSYSYHLKLDQPATSTNAEFFALFKALEWIQEHQPVHDIIIITDSQEVSSKTPHHMVPPDVHQLLHQLQNTFQHHIQIQEAKNEHQSFIEKAHNASREYISTMPKAKESLNTNKSTIPRLRSYAWISLQEQGHVWIASKRDSDIKIMHSDPVEALFEIVRLVVQHDSHTILYFDLNSTQLINFRARNDPSPKVNRLFQFLQKRRLLTTIKV